VFRLVRCFAVGVGDAFLVIAVAVRMSFDLSGFVFLSFFPGTGMTDALCAFLVVAVAALMMPFDLSGFVLFSFFSGTGMTDALCGPLFPSFRGSLRLSMGMFSYSSHMSINSTNISSSETTFSSLHFAAAVRNCIFQRSRKVLEHCSSLNATYMMHSVARNQKPFKSHPTRIHTLSLLTYTQGTGMEGGIVYLIEQIFSFCHLDSTNWKFLFVSTWSGCGSKSPNTLEQVMNEVARSLQKGTKTTASEFKQKLKRTCEGKEGTHPIWKLRVEYTTNASEHEEEVHPFFLQRVEGQAKTQHNTTQDKDNTRQRQGQGRQGTRQTVDNDVFGFNKGRTRALKKRGKHKEGANMKRDGTGHVV
jgi:hypothetical protein